MCVCCNTIYKENIYISHTHAHTHILILKTSRRRWLLLHSHLQTDILVAISHFWIYHLYPGPKGSLFPLNTDLLTLESHTNSYLIVNPQSSQSSYTMIILEWVCPRTTSNRNSDPENWLTQQMISTLPRCLNKGNA